MYRKRCVALICLAQVLLTWNTEALLVEIPENKYAFLGDQAVFKCKTDSEIAVIWQFLAYGTSDWRWIYLTGSIPDNEAKNYRMESNNGSYNIIVDIVDWSYAGRYKCTDGKHLHQVAMAELTVFDPVLSCVRGPHSVNKKHGSSCSPLDLLCQYVFVGAMTPMSSLSQYEAMTPSRNISMPNHSKTLDFPLHVERPSDCSTQPTPTNVNNNLTSENSTSLAGNCRICLCCERNAVEFQSTTSTDNALVSTVDREFVSEGVHASFVFSSEVVIPVVVLLLTALSALLVYIVHLKRIISRMLSQVPHETPAVQYEDVQPDSSHRTFGIISNNPETEASNYLALTNPVRSPTYDRLQFPNRVT